jgi:hypothetical protein
LGFTFGLTCSLCSITSLVTPTKLKVEQAKTSLFLSRNYRSSAHSSGLILLLMQTVLSSTLGSSATPLKSPSTSIALLNSAEISCLDEGCFGSCFSASSLNKCTFLCPRANPHSMILAFFSLLNVVIKSKVARTLRKRYPKCRAVLKVFNKPHLNKAL